MQPANRNARVDLERDGLRSEWKKNSSTMRDVGRPTRSLSNARRRDWVSVGRDERARRPQFFAADEIPWNGSKPFTLYAATPEAEKVSRGLHCLHVLNYLIT